MKLNPKTGIGFLAHFSPFFPRERTNHPVWDRYAPSSTTGLAYR